MKILLITQFCEPEPHFKGVLFAEELANLGYQVEVLTGFPNYPGGKIYDGYRQKLMDRREISQGVRLTRVPIYPSHNFSAWKRTLNYASFAFSVFVYALFVAKKPDVIYAYHPPLSTAVAGVSVGRLRRIPVVCDIQDLWPDALRTTGMISNERIFRLVENVCNWTYRKASHVVVLSPGFKKILTERLVPDSKVTVIPNWCDVGSTKKILLPDIDWSLFQEYFTIVFAGNIGAAQDMDSVLDAAKLVSSSDSSIRFILVGNGIELSRLKTRVCDESINNVVFIPQLAFKEIGSVLQRADVLLVHLKKDPLFKITIPSKIQSSLAAGKPLLMAVEGDSADIIRQSSSGVIAEPGNASSIARAALELASYSSDNLELMGKKSKSYYERVFSIESGCRLFDEVFKSVITRHTAKKTDL